MLLTRLIARLGSVGAGVALVLALSACGGPAPQVELPDVRGVTLDVAQEALESAGFERMEDEDHLEDRTVFMSSNWVVVEQSPAPGEMLPTETEVVLSVAKIDDDGVVDLLPEGSPVAVQLQDQAAEDERRRQEREAADAERAEQEAVVTGFSLTLHSSTIEVPPSLGRILARLPAAPPARGAPLIDAKPGRPQWLFPGRGTGGHVTHPGLAVPLRAHGIAVRHSRNAALISLASDLPAAVLADLVGLNAATAVRWARRAARDWSGYISHVEQRPREAAAGSVRQPFQQP